MLPIIDSTVKEPKITFIISLCEIFQNVFGFAQVCPSEYSQAKNSLRFVRGMKKWLVLNKSEILLSATLIAKISELRLINDVYITLHFSWSVLIK